MKTKVILSIFLSILFALTVNAQVFLKVNESEIKANFENNQLHTNLTVENPANSMTAKVKLEIIDAQDKVLATSETSQNLRRGRQSLEIPLVFNQKEDAGELLWKRLRYTITPENSGDLISNIVSLSEIMPEAFELQISSPEKIFAGMKLRAHVLALHPFTKKPIKNVEITGEIEVDLEEDDSREDEPDEIIVKAKGNTNEEGFTTLDFQIPNNIILDDCCSELKIKGVKNGIERDADDDLDVSVDSFIYLNTDKPIYQPNQKLFARGLYLDQFKHPLADKNLSFEIEDEEGETVHKGTMKTSRFGVMNIEWQIPEKFKLGTYKIEVESDDGDEESEIEFKISRYDLPNFTVTAKSAKPFYLTDEKTAEINVDAKYLFGKAVERGKIKIVQEKERRWNYEKQEYETEEGETIEGETDASGKFTGTINLTQAQEQLIKETWKRFDDVKFVAYLTDSTTNRTEQKRFDVRLTKEPIHVYFIRQSGDPNPKVPFIFYVSTFYADGTPVKCGVKIEANYDDTDLKIKIAEAETNSYGAGKFEVRLPEKPFSQASNNLHFRITADDKTGKQGILEDNLDIADHHEQIRVKSNKTIYLPNEPIDLKIFSSKNEQTAYVNVLKNSSPVYSKRIKIADGRGGLTIPFRPDFKGELTIAVYTDEQIGNGDYQTHSKTVIFPAPDNLEFNLKSLKNSYRPGEDAKISFSVQNGENKSSETAFGVLILDKAIEERAQTEQLPDNFGAIRKLLGTADSFGNLTRRDLNNLDVSKPVNDDLQLAAEFLLTGKTYAPNFFFSDSFQDDFSRIYKDYFSKKLANFEKILNENYQKDGDYPKDETALRRILSANGVNFDDLRDAWETPLQVQFSADRANAVLWLKTAGADKKIGTDDDFFVKEIRFEWFKKIQDELNVILYKAAQKNAEMPQTPEELKALWKESGIDFDSFRDGWNRPLYLTTLPYKRKIQKIIPETVGELDGKTQQVLRTKIVEQEVVVFRIRSLGEDGIQDAYTDFDLGVFTNVLSEKDLADERRTATIPADRISNSSGAISGIITDPNGAVVSNVSVRLVNQNTLQNLTAGSNEYGEFLIADLPSGKYRLTAESPGFQNYVVENIVVSAMNLIRLQIYLNVGSVTETVDVMAQSYVTLNTSSAMVSRNVNGSEAKSIAGYLENGKNIQSFTPRVREYFPETLLWNPELITGKNGKAELDFKLGDNLTTWKLYAVGSTASGELGLIEKEFQTFQPFFAELDPPKILTVGDQISLPIPVRNYTNKSQKVNVSLAENNWSKNLQSATQNIEIAPNSTQNAVFNFQATAIISGGKQKVTALAKKEGDAIEKTVTVRPNGKEIVQTQSASFEKESAFDVNFPAGSLISWKKAELKIYPNMLAHVAEAVEGLLVRPHGCGEQTTSSTYPNLLILKIEKELKKEIDPKLKAQANEYLIEGYKRLLTYQTPSGGFSYWGKTDTPNIALTAYVLRFLKDAGEFIKVDETVIENAQKWLLSQQNSDGSWQGNPMTTAYIARVFASKPESDANAKNALQNAAGFLHKQLPEIKDSSTLANLALIAIAVDDRETAKSVVEKLQNMAQPDKESKFWSTGSTPFHGWGQTAAIETTALVVQSLLKFGVQNLNFKLAENDELIAGGLAFLLKNKDKYGVWYSTQTTVNVLDALILLQKTRLEKAHNQPEKGEIFINGKKAQEFIVSANDLKNPLVFDLTSLLTQTENRVEIKGLDNANLTMAQLVSTHFLKWENVKTEENKYFDLKVDFDKTEAKIGDEISCSVAAKQKFYRYGMMLAEIGLPPGAEVDRRSLDLAKANGEFSSYDVLPDKILIYFWAKQTGLNFDFKFKPRYGIAAQTAPSIIYDYYNEEANAAIAPVKFEVK